MNSYNAQTTAHATYILTIAIGIVAILYQMKLKSFFGIYSWKQRLAFFYLPLSSLSAGIVFVLLRTIFWAWMGIGVLTIPNDIVVKAPVMFGVQNHLIYIFLTQTHGWASLAYYLNDISFGSPFILLLAFSFLLLLDVDLIYHIYKSKFRVQLGKHIHFSVKGTRKYVALFFALIPFVIVLICIFMPTYTAAPIQNFLIQNSAQGNVTTGYLNKFL